MGASSLPNPSPKPPPPPRPVLPPKDDGSPAPRPSPPPCDCAPSPIPPTCADGSAGADGIVERCGRERLFRALAFSRRPRKRSSASCCSFRRRSTSSASAAAWAAATLAFSSSSAFAAVAVVSDASRFSGETLSFLPAVDELAPALTNMGAAAASGGEEVPSQSPMDSGWLAATNKGAVSLLLAATKTGAPVPAFSDPRIRRFRSSPSLS
mmetsp:Transcript_2769/g.6614  ORF Transcript_2769/g.6614 Transcript_2769/m.6614 type:complete len:210 (-) Transcript_2769:970-1599(-)